MEEGDDERQRVEGILGTLRRHGGRVTETRRALVQALVKAPAHVTADDLAAVVSTEHPEIHRSTVYRTLETLQQAGVVSHVHLGHGRAVYHLTDEPHQHLVCEACGKVTEVPDALIAGLSRRLSEDYGFKVGPHHFALMGLCASCAYRHPGSGPAS